MFKIYDGRSEFYQWDLDRKVIVEDKSINQVHFCNRTDNCSLVTEVYDLDGLRVADVPNILLQNDWRINVYAYDHKYTKHSEVFEVVRRSKPADYIYTETELKTLDALVERMDNIESTIGEQVEDYLEANPPEVELTDYYTKGEVDTAIKEAVDAIEVPEVDMTGYATEQYVNEQIGKIEIPDPDLSDYAKKSDIPSLAPYATKAYVNDAIQTNKPNLTGYATEKYVDDAVNNAPYATKQDVIDAIGDISSFDIEIVTSLSSVTNANMHTIYYVPNGNHYDEYMYVDGQWELIGNTELDLTGYATEEYVQEQLESLEIPDPDLTDYAKKTDIPSLDGYATQDYVDIQISYINTEGAKEVYVGTEAPAAGSSYEVWINPDENVGFMTKEEANELYVTAEAVEGMIPDVSKYQTADQVQTAITTALSSIGVAEEGAY